MSDDVAVGPVISKVGRLEQERDAAIALLRRAQIPIDYAIEQSAPVDPADWCDLQDEIASLLGGDA